MDEKKEVILAENLNLTGIVKFMCETYGHKLSGKPFKMSDCQQYVRISKLPDYLGNVEIRLNKNIPSVKLYNLVKIGE